MRNNAVCRATTLLVCVLFVSLACVSLLAQSAPEGRLAGVVRDPSGASIAGASVVVTNDATNLQYTATTSGEGSFVVPSLLAGNYTVTITAKGFATGRYTAVKVDASREVSLTANLKVGAAATVVEVVAGQELVNTTSSEISNTVTTYRVENLPLLGRDVYALFSSQPGVGGNARSNTTINGARPSWSQNTLDGINIQDLFIRTNAIDYIPFRPTTDVVSEFTINTATQGADAVMGTNGVRMITRSGSNAFHGKVFEYNRNSLLAANDWFNNNSGTKRPFRNRNEFGANMGGPVIKNKLFFFGYYEAIRDRRARQVNAIIPAHDDYLTGVFRYMPDVGDPLYGTMQTVNVMTLAGMNAGTTVPMTVDSKIQSDILSQLPSASLVNNYSRGNSSASRVLNTAGLQRNYRYNYDRTSWGGKVDYELAAKHHLEFTMSWMHEVTDRSDLDPFNTVPTVTNDEYPLYWAKLFTGAWRWNISPTLINNLRIGGNIAPAPFNTSYVSPGYLMAVSSTSSNTATLTGLGVVTPQVPFQKQGRTPAIHQYMDDATWIHGNHTLSFGGQYQNQNINTYNDAGKVLTYTPGFSTSAPLTVQLAAGNFPTAIAQTDIDAANGLRAFLGGIVSSDAQTFNVASKTSGYVAGQTTERNLALKDLSFYAQDKWRLKSNLTLTYGVRWEYLSPYTEINGLQLGPVYANPDDPLATIMSPTGTVDFLKQAYNKDMNNFAPTVGVAWDPFKNGKTVIRGGWSLAFVNDDVLRFAGNAADGNPGLSSSVSKTKLYTTVASGPSIAAPAFSMPHTFADQLAISPTSVVWALDPNVRTPKVHNFSLSLERELPGDVGVAVRYVGTIGRGLLRGVDLNQNNAGSNAAYLADFQRARTNAFLSSLAGLGFKPAYNAAVPSYTSGGVTYSEQPLTYIPTITGANTYLNYSTVLSYLQSNSAADLADFYVVNRSIFTNAPNLFLPNSGIYAVDYGTNAASTDYHSLQFDVHRRFRNGVEWQANYVWSKLLSTTANGDSNQNRFDPYLDNARPYLAKARSTYDYRHVLKMNGVYELPMGKGKALFGNVNSVLNHIIGGWQASGIYTWQSGAPVTIGTNLSYCRGTFNRCGRSGVMTAVSNLTMAELEPLLGMMRDPKYTTDPKSNSMYWINPSVINPSTGRAVGSDNIGNTPATNFTQVFMNPGAGQIGNLGLLAFSGPAYQQLDLGFGKNDKITERVQSDFRVDFFNAFNHPIFYVGDQDINSPSFGKITSTTNSPRTIQFSLRVTF